MSNKEASRTNCRVTPRIISKPRGNNKLRVLDADPAAGGTQFLPAVRDNNINGSVGAT
jgi:hypothetical protein